MGKAADPRGLAVLYAAKSSPDEKGSIPDQLKETRAWAEEQGLQVIAQYSEEDVTAYKGDRGLELARAMEHAQEAGATLVTQHSDRLARGDAKQARHLVEIALWAIKAEVRVHCVQDPRTFESLLMATVMGDRNMEDSRRKAAAIKAGLARRRRRGQYTGEAPLGYRLQRNEADQRVLTVNAERALIVRRIYTEYLRGATLLGIAQGLNADGILPQKAKRWDPVGIRSVLMNPVFAGFLRDGEELVRATHEPIIDLETWEQAETLREAKRRSYRRGRPSAGKHLFRKGFLKCGICGAAMSPRTRRDHPDTPGAESYLCSGRSRRGRACGMPAIGRAKVDEAIYAYFGQLELDVEATREQLAGAVERKIAEIRELICSSEQEVQEAQAWLARVRGDYVSGELAAAEWRELRAELESEASAAKAEAERLKEQLAKAEGESTLANVTAGVLAQLSEIRAVVAKEVENAEGAAAVRAVLLRLFDGFVLRQGGPEPGKEHLKKSPRWIEPLISKLAVAGYEETPQSVLLPRPHGEAKNNLSLPMSEFPDRVIGEKAPVEAFFLRSRCGHGCPGSGHVGPLPCSHDDPAHCPRSFPAYRPHAAGCRCPGRCRPVVGSADHSRPDGP